MRINLGLGSCLGANATIAVKYSASWTHFLIQEKLGGLHVCCMIFRRMTFCVDSIPANRICVFFVNILSIISWVMTSVFLFIDW